MIVGLDATPLLGARTGIGRYVENLLAALTDPPLDGPSVADPSLVVTPTAFTLRGRDQLAAAVPAGMVARSRPIPANLLQQLWLRFDVPPVELLCGAVEVFHGTNFILPPMRRARGVVTIHDLAYLRMPDVVEGVTNRLRQLVPRGLTRAEVVCTPSQATADDVADAYNVAADRLMVTPLGVDPAWFVTPAPSPEFRARFGLPTSYIVAVGTQEPRKGLDVLLSALRQLPDSPPLALVGPRGWGPALEMAGLGEGRVVELGYLDTEDLRSVVTGAACLIFPSRYEGFGLPPLEAAACGVASVVSDLAVCREVMGEHVRCAEVGSAEALAEAIRLTLSDGGPTTREQRVAHAQAFTWQRCAELTRAAYEKAAG